MKTTVLSNPSAAWSLLQAHASGLLYLSESDQPFELVQNLNGRKSFGPEDVHELTGHSSEKKVEHLSVADFFAQQIRQYSPAGPGGLHVADRYKTLQTFFEVQLTDAKVFRVGDVRVDIFVVGRVADGQWVGLRTLAIET